MFCLNPHHRMPETTRLIYRGEAGVEIKAQAPKSKERPEAVLEFDPSKSPDEIWQMIDEKYGKTPYEKLISEYVDTLMPTIPGNYRAALLAQSAERYMKAYEQIRKGFFNQSQTLKKEFDTATRNIKIQTNRELTALKSSLKGAQKLVSFKEEVPNPETIREPAVRAYFYKYMLALNGRYFNERMNAGSGNPKEYRRLSGRFKNNMNAWVKNRLTWLLKRKKTSQKDLEAFRNQVATRYEQIARLDKNSAIISSVDLAKLEIIAKPPPENIDRVLSESDSQMMNRLEVMQLMAPEALEQSVTMMNGVIIREAISNGSEKAFVKAIGKYRRVKTFDQAKKAFRQMTKDMSKVSVSATIRFIQKINKQVHNPVLSHELNIKPKSLTVLVHRQTDYLLSGILIPQKEEDAHLVRFMQAGRKGREAMLKNKGSRQILFRAIRIATDKKYYPAVYEQQFGRVPDDVKKLRTSKRLHKPTYHDRAAQLQALMVLGKQAKVIVGNFEGEEAVAAMEKSDAPEDVKAVLLGLRFKPAIKEPAKFQSALHRGGFNTLGLALKGLKVLGALAIVSNVFQSYSEAEGDNKLDKFFDALGRSAKNPSLIVGAAAMVGAHKAERNKAYLRWPWLSQHEKAGVRAADKLDSIGRRLPNGYQKLNRFTRNRAEWEALNHSKLDASTIKDMLKSTAERTKGTKSKPVILPEDLKKAGVPESITSRLTAGTQIPRIRYLFYSKFFAGGFKPDVPHVKELCTNSSLI